MRITAVVNISFEEDGDASSFVEDRKEALKGLMDALQFGQPECLDPSS